MSLLVRRRALWCGDEISAAALSSLVLALSCLVRLQALRWGDEPSDVAASSLVQRLALPASPSVVNQQYPLLKPPSQGKGVIWQTS